MEYMEWDVNAPKPP